MRAMIRACVPACAVLSVCAAPLVACDPYDADLIRVRRKPDASRPTDAGEDGMVTPPPTDSGADGKMPVCVKTGDEICDNVDNDCDGTVDERTEVAADCAAKLPHRAMALCVDGECIGVGCMPDYAVCRGLPTSDCEPYCSCNPCDDGGADDSGADGG